MPPVMDAFYVLRPTPALCEWLKERDVPGWLGLDRPHVWSQREIPRDHDYVGQGEDAETFLKLAVLARVLRLRDSASRADSDDDPQAVRVLTELLGPPPLTVETFDRWWRLERVQGLYTVEDTLAHTPVRTLRQVRGPDKRSPTVEAHRASYAMADINDGPSPVGERWDAAILDREEDLRRLRCAVPWVLERLAEKTPHRTCVLELQPFSLDEPVGQALSVPGWTLSSRGHGLREGIKLTLEDVDWGDDAWTFTYRVHSGELRSSQSGTARLKFEETPHGWQVQSGSLEP